MNDQNIQQDLKKPIRRNNHDKINEKFMKAVNLFSIVDFRVIRSQINISKNEQPTEMLVHLYKHAIKNDYEYFKKILISGNVKLIESIMRTSLRFKRKVVIFEWVNTLGKSYGNNLLHKFIFFSIGHRDARSMLEIAEIFLNYGVPINETDKRGCTPLFVSIEKKNIPLALFLINRGANVHIRNNREETALIEAAESGNAEVVDLLLSRGADVNAKDTYGWTALHKSCRYNRENVIDLLVRKGADVSIQDKLGETPLSFLLTDWLNYERCLIHMMKGFSKLSLDDASIVKRDMDSIEANPKAMEHFKKCVAELKLMKKYPTYYCVLKMSNDTRNLAALAKSVEFVSEFERNLSLFSYFKNDLKSIFDDAVEIRD